MNKELPALDPIIDSISLKMHQLLGDKLIQLWLFGSRARGDARPDSDYDLLVVADGDVKTLKTLVREVEWNCMEQHYILVSCIVYTPQQWAERQDSPLGINILREGKLVA